MPNRAQSAAEILYEFVSKTVRKNAGEPGMRFFLPVSSLFMFILASEMAE